MLPVIKSLDETRWHILVGLLLLVPVSVLPCVLGVAGWTYLITTIVLNSAFLLVGVQGFGAGDVTRWARRLFLVSLIYLTTLYAVLLIT